jgi:tetratricopeptide (TPR) repeat protein
MSGDDRRRRDPAPLVGSLHVGEGGTGVRVEVGAAPEPRHSTLPNQSGKARFSGRRGDLAAVIDAFAEPDRPAVLVLHGDPGVGKSRLAIEYGEKHRARYPGGTFFVDMSLTPPIDLARLLPLFRLERGATESIEDQCRRALNLLGQHPTLIVYDNVADEGALSDWLPPAGLTCHVLATTTLGDWPASRNVHGVDRLSDDDGRELVSNVVRNKEAARAWASELLRSAGGLTVELVAAASAIDKQTRLGRPGALAASLAQDTVSSFGRAWQILPDDAKQVLGSASWFETTRIPPDALRALWIGEGWPEGRFDDALDAAIDRTLIARKGEVLDMHQCIARFVDEQSSPALPDALRRRHFDAFVQASRSFSRQPANLQLGAALRAYPVSPTLWAALVPARSAEFADEAHWVGYALYTAGRFEEARGWFERAVEAKEKGDAHGPVDPASLGRSLHEVGTCYSSTGKYDEARVWFQRAVEAKKKGDVRGRIDPDGLGSSLYLIGFCYSSTGKYDEARVWFERAVEAKEKGDMHGRVDSASLGSSLHQVGYCYSGTWKYAEARLWFERAVAEAEKGDVHGRVDAASLGSSLQQVGICYFHAGKYDEARVWFERAVEAMEKGDVHGRVDPARLGTSLHLIGNCYSSSGKYDEARLWFERAVEAKEKGDVHGRVDQESLGTSLHEVGNCYASSGKYDEARLWFERAVAATEKGDLHGRVDPASLGTSLHLIGNCYSSSGKYDEARLWFERAVAEAEKGDVHGRVDPASAGRSLHEVGTCYASTGKYDEARLWFERAVAEAEKGDMHCRLDPESLGMSLHQVGICYSRTGKYDEARLWFERAVAAKEKGDMHGRVDPASLEISRSALATVEAYLRSKD